ncbi:MAG: hypothetical protein JWN95_777 [Frankiales bacterium]|nr:hypothetical protein [Frankiales bacterium]
MSDRRPNTDRSANTGPVDLSRSDALLAFSERARHHTNDAHQHELCRYVANSLGRPVHTVIGAQLSALGPHGAEVHWVDEDGAGSFTIRFDHEAKTVPALADALRIELEVD